LSLGYANPPPIFHAHSFRRSDVSILGELAEGQEGISYVLYDGASGDTFKTELTNATGVAPVQSDANAYDSAAILMLASLIAARPLADPTALTGAQIRDAIHSVADAAGTVVGVGPSELLRAVSLIGDGKPIDYEGASGPCDFDALGNVKNKLVHYKFTGGQFVDLEKYDCVVSDACPVLK
jgi:hypothetical protein